MTDKRIKVVLLEGEFAALSAMGFPTSVCLQLQESGLKVTEAMWSTKSSSAGFSVSFFWPALTNLSNKASRRKRRKRHRNNNATSMKSKSSPASVPTKGATVQPDNGERSVAASVTPISDHQTTKESFNLSKCHDIIYEKKGDEHGVTYHTSDNKQEWTPVVRKRRKHPVVHRPGPRAGSLQEDRGCLEPSTDDSSDDSPVSPLSIPSHAKVEYVEIDGTYVLGHVAQEAGPPLQLELG